MPDTQRPLPPPGKIGRRQQGMIVVKPRNMRGTLRRLWVLTKGQRQGLAWIFFFSALASCSAVLSPYLIGKTVNSIDTGSLGWLFPALLAGVYVCDWLSRFLQQFLMAAVGQRVVGHLRKEIFSAMRKLPLAFFDQSSHGDLMSRLTNDVDNISITISDSLTQLMMLGFTIVGVLGIMLSLNPFLTGVSLISVVLVFLLTKVITGHTRKLFKEQQQILGRLNGQIEEGIAGLAMVKAFGREAAMFVQFEEENLRLQKVGTQALIWSGYLMPIMNVINNLSFLAVATISGVMAARGMIPVGVISSFVLYSRQLGRPFMEIANIYNTFQTAVAGAERIFEIFDETGEPEDVRAAQPLVSPRGEIRFEHVSFGYEAGRPILRDLSFAIPAGTKAAIVGPTGAGKTTIINLLPRFYDIWEGSILLDGRDLKQYQKRDLRNAFGIVLQDPSLFGVSVLENIRYGYPEASEEQVRAAAQAAGADSFIKRLPRGYDTVLGPEGSALSQGERQLLTIARAILGDSPIMILDEATSSVDTVTEQRIRKAMLKLTEGRTSFIIAHRLSTIRDSDVIILLEDGRIAEMGSHEQLMKRKGKYADLYHTQTGGMEDGKTTGVSGQL